MPRTPQNGNSIRPNDQLRQCTTISRRCTSVPLAPGTKRTRSTLPCDHEAVNIGAIRYGDGVAGEDWLSLAQQVWPGNYGLDEVTAALARTSNIGAWDGDTLVGAVRVLSDGHFFSTVPEILVLLTYQLRGIGRALMQRALEVAPRGKLFFGAQPQSVGFCERLGTTVARLASLRADQDSTNDSRRARCGHHLRRCPFGVASLPEQSLENVEYGHRRDSTGWFSLGPASIEPSQRRGIRTWFRATSVAAHTAEAQIQFRLRPHRQRSGRAPVRPMVQLVRDHCAANHSGSPRSYAQPKGCIIRHAC